MNIAALHVWQHAGRTRPAPRSHGTQAQQHAWQHRARAAQVRLVARWWQAARGRGSQRGPLQDTMGGHALLLCGLQKYQVPVYGMPGQQPVAMPVAYNPQVSGSGEGAGAAAAGLLTWPAWHPLTWTAWHLLTWPACHLLTWPAWHGAGV